MVVTSGWEGAEARPGCTKGLWEVQPALQERRAPLPTYFGGEERGWSKSQGRVLRGVAFEVGMDKVELGERKEEKP